MASIRRRTTHVFIALFILSVIVTVLLSQWLGETTPTRDPLTYIATEPPISAPPSRGFLVDTSACRIPDIDPFDPSIASAVRLRGIARCVGRPSLTYVDGFYLRLNRTVMQDHYGGDFSHCKMQPVLRSTASDSSFDYGSLGESFSEDVRMEHDFVRIYCFSTSSGTIYVNFHAFVLPDPTRDAKYDQDFKHHVASVGPSDNLNVLMVGVDSVSRLNMLRQMPRTRALLQQLGAVEMLGYTKVADNTFVNIVPMTTGRFVEELPWNESMVEVPFDSYDFAWRVFSQRGYRTLYAEDCPGISIFNYHKAGFRNPPADHYNRAFALAMERHRAVWNRDHHCVGDRLETSMVLDYVIDFASLYRNAPHFGFAFITRLTHEDANDAGMADDPYFRFLSRMRDEGFLEKTALFFFSDHGVRFGSIRETFVGKMEERLPFLYVLLPSWFLNKYPQAATNLRTNARRLTTPFDVHSTLLELLEFHQSPGPPPPGARGVSLLREVPESRTCLRASILPHWCVCLSRRQLRPDLPRLRVPAKFVLHFINDLLFPFRHECAHLQLARIRDAVLMQPNEHVLKFKDSHNDVINRTVEYGERTPALVLYQMTLETTPGGGLFEATVASDTATGRLTMGGDVSRINAYGGQSHCVGNAEAKKFCYCLELEGT